MVTVALIPLLPLAGAVVLGLFRRRLQAWAGWIATSAVAGSFFFGLMAFGELLNRPVDQRLIGGTLYRWIEVGSLSVPLQLEVDVLGAVMVLVVTGVGALIHIYSVGYMADDPHRGAYFAYLNLFVASMLLLVLARNFLVLYVGWEAVGLCSYLLISFWRDRPEAAAAGKKAFIVNRIGDFGLLLGILLIFRTFGTLDFERVFSSVEAAPLVGGVAAAIPLLLFAGAVGKSAQFPLHIWLPDAMEGPTPVSALIHAATMVTAGVYLVARAHPLFEGSAAAAGTVAIVGAFTALFAALIAVVQDDIKRVLAYSTISQLGYMFLAVGIGALTGSPAAYAAGIFYLVAHAFFKALLFLGAGSVMHATGGVTDMKQMGGLRGALPATSSVFLIGWLAIIGAPPLAGFFSKDAVLQVAWESGRPILWAVGVAVALITALYMSRQVFLVFFGPSRLDEEVQPHESPSSMTSPMWALAALAAGGGLLGLSVHGGWITRFLRPAFGEGAAGGAAAIHLPEPVLALFALTAAAIGVAGAWRLYLAPGAEDRRRSLRERWAGAIALLQGGFYIDDLYGAALVWPGRTLAGLAAFGFDIRVVDGAVNAVGRGVTAAAARVRLLQTGMVRRYAMAIFTGIVALVTLVVVRLR